MAQKKPRDRALLVVGIGFATAALVATSSSCSSSSDGGGDTDAGYNSDGPVGNTALPVDSGRDADADTVFNPDGPVGNTALPDAGLDTGSEVIDDTDASEAPGDSSLGDADGE